MRHFHIVCCWGGAGDEYVFDNFFKCPFKCLWGNLANGFQLKVMGYELMFDKQQTIEHNDLCNTQYQATWVKLISQWYCSSNCNTVMGLEAWESQCKVLLVNRVGHVVCPGGVLRSLRLLIPPQCFTSGVINYCNMPQLAGWGAEQGCVCVCLQLAGCVMCTSR